jgi:hypothetical protein
LQLAKHDPDLEQTVNDIARSIEPATAPTDEPDGLTFEEASAEFLSALDEMAVEASAPVVSAPVASTATMLSPPAMASQAGPDPSLPQLERFLHAIHSYRQRRAV